MLTMQQSKANLMGLLRNTSFSNVVGALTAIYIEKY